MVAAVFAHLVRVFLTGAYKNGADPAWRREWNWVIGVGLLLLTLLLSFSGYLLPWDQLAFWAVTIGTNIAVGIPIAGRAVGDMLIGGRAIGQATLIRFYVLHVFILPAIWLVLFCYHVWRIRKDGGLACADRIELTASEPPDLAVNASPILARRLAVVMLGTAAVIGMLAALIVSPLQAPANPLVTPNPAKSPWYFLWLQEIVTDTTVHLGPISVNGALLGGVVLPGALLALMTLWPWLDRSPASAAGTWFARERRGQAVACLAIVGAMVLLTVIGAFMRGPGWDFYWPWQAWPELPTRF
jgi:quinol-cytochrome oxidoreductase complex cytochrome b subunit